MSITASPIPRRTVRALSCALATAVLLLAPTAADTMHIAAASGAAGTSTSPQPGSATREQSASTDTGDDPSGARYHRGRAGTAVGQILSDTTSCTATVVGSDSGQVVVTAAHCVFVPETDVFGGGYSLRHEPGWVEGLQFYPGRHGDDAPFGVWRIERAWVDQHWQSSGDPAFDVAFLRIAEQGGRTVADVVGAQPISFAGGNAMELTALGYPMTGPFDGTTLRRCRSDEASADPAYPGALAMDCAMKEGASGGPWLAGFDSTEGTGTVVGVTSFVPLDRSDRMFASVLSGFAAELHRTADGS